MYVAGAEGGVSFHFLFFSPWLTVHSMIRGLMLLLEKTAKLTKERKSDASMSTFPNLSSLTVWYPKPF